MTQKLASEELVDFVIETQKRLGDGPALVDAIAALGMTTQEAGVVVSTVRDAYFRTMLYSAGAQPQNFSGDYETDPLFQAALRRYQASSPGRSSSQPDSLVVRSAWLVAILVGLAIVAIVAYYIVDLLRASR